MDKVRCMLIQSYLPKSLWAKTLKTTCYLVNCDPSVALIFKTLFEMWHDRPTSNDNLKVFRYLELVLKALKELVYWHQGF